MTIGRAERPSFFVLSFGRVLQFAVDPSSIRIARRDRYVTVWDRVQARYIELGEMSPELDPATFLDGSFVGGVNDCKTTRAKGAIATWKEANEDILSRDTQGAVGGVRAGAERLAFSFHLSRTILERQGRRTHRFPTSPSCREWRCRCRHARLGRDEYVAEGAKTWTEADPDR